MQATVKEGSRVGRGFSIAELKEAGLDIRIARNNGVPTDVWRDTKYPENVEKLRSLAKGKGNKEGSQEKARADSKHESKGDSKAKDNQKVYKEKDD
jgi:ribosomal protein L13E